MKKIWLFAAMSVFLAAGVLFPRQEVMTRIAPGSTVRSAVRTAAADLRTRLEESPVIQVAEVLSNETKDIRIRLDRSEKGSIDGSASVQPGKIRMDGTLFAENGEINLSCYADGTFMALSSEAFTGGRWLGVAYDTFSEDIRKIPLVSWFLPDRVIESWENSLEKLRSRMEHPLNIPRIPQWEEEKLELLLLGLSALPAKAETVPVPLEGEAGTCQRVVFQAGPETLGTVLGQEASPGDSGTAAFYLLDSRLILTDVTVNLGQEEYRLRLETGRDPLINPLSLLLERRSGSAVETFRARLSTKELEGIRREYWQITVNQRNLELICSRQENSALVRLQDGQGLSADLSFGRQEGALTLETGQPGALERMITGREAALLDGVSGLSAVITPGNGVTTPQYRKPDTWSTEDFLALMEGLGTLFGLRMV